MGGTEPASGARRSGGRGRHSRGPTPDKHQHRAASASGGQGVARQRLLRRQRHVALPAAALVRRAARSGRPRGAGRVPLLLLPARSDRDADLSEGVPQAGMPVATDRRVPRRHVRRDVCRRSSGRRRRLEPLRLQDGDRLGQNEGHVTGHRLELLPRAARKRIGTGAAFRRDRSQPDRVRAAERGLQAGRGRAGHL